jgi:hypothetical protein
MLTSCSFINRKETEQYAAIAAEYLSSIAGKVLAKIMLSRLVEHISEGVLPETQCGFRKNRSTTGMVFVLRQLLE